MTYSILGRDPETGELGVAVQSQAFNTGAAVPWARPGVGVVATQSFTDRRYGYRGLELLAAGASAAVRARRAARARRTGRLPPGRVHGRGRRDGAVDGRRLHPARGQCRRRELVRAGKHARRGRMDRDGRGVHVHGRVAGATADGRARRCGGGGGDWRGRGGAGIVVVPAEGEPWERVVDLRVEDGDDSLVELRRLLGLAEGYRRANQRPARGPGRGEGRPPRGIRPLPRDARRGRPRRRGRGHGGCSRRSSPSSRCGSRRSGGSPGTRRCRRSGRSSIPVARDGSETIRSSRCRSSPKNSTRASCRSPSGATTARRSTTSLNGCVLDYRQAAPGVVGKRDGRSRESPSSKLGQPRARPRPTASAHRGRAEHEERKALIEAMLLTAQRTAARDPRFGAAAGRRGVASSTATGGRHRT